MGRFPVRIKCRQCSRNIKREKRSARCVMKFLLEIPNAADIYDFEKDFFCSACYFKIVKRKFHKLAVPRVRVNTSGKEDTASVPESGVNEMICCTEQCLVCNVKCANDNNESTNLLGRKKGAAEPPGVSKELDIIFVLRTLLRVSPDKLEGYLQDFGNPSEWKLTLCGDCRPKATLAREMHQVILNATCQLGKVQKYFLEKVKSLADGDNYGGDSNKEEDGSDSGGDDEERHLRILKETRDFVLNHNYGTIITSTSFVQGDEQAADLLKRRQESVSSLEDEEDGTIKKEVEEAPSETDDWEDANPGSFPGIPEADDIMNEETVNVIKQEGELENDIRKPQTWKKQDKKTGVAHRGNRVKTKFGRGPSIQCFLCDATLKNDLAWNYHLQDVHQKSHIICPVENCRKIIQGSSRMQEYRRHQLVHRDKSHLTCGKCGRVYNWKRNLVQHLRDAHTEKAEARRALIRAKQEQRLRPINCILCDIDLFGPKAFREHNKDVHGTGRTGAVSSSEKKEHKCRFCGAKLASFDTLYSHISVVHLHRRRKRHVCHSCGDSFAFLAHLKCHVFRKHPDDPVAEAWRQEGSTLIQCPVKGCRRLFIQKGTFGSHMAKVHEELGGAGPHTCTFCGKGFFQKMKLTRHELIHKNEGTSNYLCVLCGKSFSTPDYLYVHERYTCSQRKLGKGEANEGEEGAGANKT